MKCYLVERTDLTGYDEVDSFIILANNYEEAFEVASKESWGDWDFISSDINIKEIELTGKPRVIHCSYISG